MIVLNNVIEQEILYVDEVDHMMKLGYAKIKQMIDMKKEKSAMLIILFIFGKEKNIILQNL